MTGDTQVDTGADAHASVDAPADVVADAPVDAPAAVKELYFITQQGFMPPLNDDLERVDLARGAVTVDQPMNGALDVCYAGGNLYVVRGSGQARVSVLQLGTLNITSNIVLPADPAAAVFSADCSSVFVGTSGGQIMQVGLPSGNAVGAPISVPLPSGSSGSPQLTGLGIDASGTQLGVTEFSGSSSSVAIVYKAGSNWALGLTVASQPVSGSNCGREAASPAFSPDGTLLSTFDPNCGTYDVYTVATGMLNATVSAQFTRPSGVSFSGGSIWDHNNQVWSTNVSTVYRTSETGMPATFPLPASAGALGLDDTGLVLYFVPYDPHTSGAYTIDTTTGATTALGWNLGLVPSGSGVTRIRYVVR